MFTKYACTQLGDGETSFPILSLIGTIAFYGLAFIFLTSCLLSSINFAVYQRKLNKMKIGNASLIVSLVLLAVSIIASIVIIVVMI